MTSIKREFQDVLDEFLVLRCQDGETEALEELVRRWQKQLLGHAWRLTGDGNAARDIVQESWLAIAGGIRRLKDPALFNRWAYRIVSHKSADWVRRRQRDRRLAVSVARSLDGETQAEPEPAATDDDIAALRRAIRRLSPDHKVILSLYYFDEKGIPAIAEILSIPAGTVKSRLYHARQHLRRRLERRPL